MDEEVASEVIREELAISEELVATRMVDVDTRDSLDSLDKVVGNETELLALETADELERMEETLGRLDEVLISDVM